MPPRGIPPVEESVRLKIGETEFRKPGATGEAEPSPLTESPPPEWRGDNAGRQEYQRRYGQVEPGTPFSVRIWGRVSGGEDWSPAPTFREILSRNSLFGGKIHPLASGRVFTLGSRPTLARNYNKDGMNYIRKGDGGVVTRDQALKETGKEVSNFVGFPENGKIKFEQASIREENGKLLIRNLTREPLVWVRVGSEWRWLGPDQEIPLEDGAWILLGSDPSTLEDYTLDPQHYTVLHVEDAAAGSLGPRQWNLIEFQTREPDKLEKIPTQEAYLAALLGQSEAFVTRFFGRLFKALKGAGWGIPTAKRLFLRIFGHSPVLAERNIGMLADVLESAQRSGWSPEQLENLLSNEAFTKKHGFGFLKHLPQLLEKSAALGVTPEELTGLLTRMAKYDDGPFSPSVEALPELLDSWWNSEAGAGTERLKNQIAFLDLAEVAVESLGGFLSKIPGGEDLFITMMVRLLPELRDRSGLGGKVLTRLSAEILAHIVEHALPKPPPVLRWVEDVLLSLPDAFGQLFGLSRSDQRATLLGVAKEQGVGFPQHWAAFQREAQNAETSGNNDGQP